MKSSIALVVPVFNPHPGWEKLLHQRFTELSMALTHIDFKLYLVNDGSAIHVGKTEVDYLRNQLPEFHFTDLPQNQGKGYALRQAVQQTSEPFTVYTDADMPFTLQSMEAVIGALPQNDIAFGIKQKAYYEQLPLQRKMVS
ncbi:MAG: glycosyltransferase, partial [Chitinophagaceae bacterium]|nr:glycosyltransferase [Chitinophagaceae bacterium]